MVSATLIAPRTCPSHATTVTVAPAASSAAMVSARPEGMGRDHWVVIQEARPAATIRPSTMPCTPCPASAWNDSTAASGPLAALVMARPMGCSEPCSSAPATCTSSVSSVPAAGWVAVTVMVPAVMVPVLSSTTVSMRRVCSSTCGPRMRMPSCAPRPVPTSSAVGVASPSAQGHAMISVVTAAVNATSGEAPPSSHTVNATMARAMTMGTKIAETRSARRCTCAFPVCASSTSLAIRASSVSAPTRVSSTSSRPPVFTVAPTTFEPGATSTGTDSPVSIDSSTAETPSVTTPSAGIFSPGRTTTMSPGTSWATGTRCSLPVRRTTASFAPSSSRARRASPDCRFARVSR